MTPNHEPGTPGRTTIPKDVVRDVTMRLGAQFRKYGPVRTDELLVTAQQRFLYIETRLKPREGLPALVDARTVGKPPAVPLGRMVWNGNPARWRFERYKWSDECWDEANDAGTIGGSPEACFVEALLGDCG